MGPYIHIDPRIVMAYQGKEAQKRRRKSLRRRAPPMGFFPSEHSTYSKSSNTMNPHWRWCKDVKMSYNFLANSVQLDFLLA